MAWRDRLRLMRSLGKMPARQGGTMADTKDKPQVTPERLMQFAWGYAIPLIVEAAAG